MWSLTGECVQVIEGHKGRGIWSMCINKDNSKVVNDDERCVMYFDQIFGR